MGLLDIFRKKEKNINLLPEEQAAAGRSWRDFIIAPLIPILVIVLIAFVFAALFTLEQNEARKSRDLEEEISQEVSKWQQFSEEANAVKLIKSNISDYEKVSGQSDKILKISKDIRSVIPKFVSLSNLTVEETGSVSLDGFTQKPKSIFQLYTNLINNPEKFSNVKLVSIGFDSKDDKDNQGGGKVKGFTFTISLEVKADEEKSS